MPPSGRTSQKNSRFVVGCISVAEGGSLDVLDRGVVGLDLSCRGAGNDQHLDLFPPPADGAVEPVRLRPCGCLDQFLEYLFGRCGVFQEAGSEQNSELLFDLPDRPEDSSRDGTNLPRATGADSNYRNLFAVSGRPCHSPFPRRPMHHNPRLG